MTDPHCAAPADVAFVAELNELREQAGSPPYSELRRLSSRTGEGRGHRELAESTTHDILTGKRERLPPWPWVASYVAACRLAARETGLDVDALGDIKDWHAKWLAARAAPVVAPAMSASAASAVLPRQTQDRRPRDDIDEHEPSWSPRDFVRHYGRTGARLLRWAEAGDEEACFRIGVVMLLDGRQEEARRWLGRAHAAGNDAAPLLRRHHDAEAAAAELAYLYGQEYEEAEGKLSIAMFYYRLAGHHGHADAAYRLGAIHAGRGEPWLAAMWFNRATRAGHPWGAHHFNDISHHLVTSREPHRAPPDAAAFGGGGGAAVRR
ncbi:hypothetical protein ABGB17_16980 [Sphaerisporangium sp. B11E5]|uniref:tetratricopeptide repeat protein n=1 Tax=Sphaerisporangium sp. B11E5 TaxID=3153563 RepID=UPI00325DBA11